MKTLYLVLAIAWLIIAVATIVTQAQPSVFVVFLMCLIISFDSFEDYFRVKNNNNIRKL